MLLLLLLVVVAAPPVSFAEETDPIGASTRVVRRQMVRTTAAAANANPEIASYLLGSSLLNLHRVACLPLLLLLPPIPDWI